MLVISHYSPSFRNKPHYNYQRYFIYSSLNALPLPNPFSPLSQPILVFPTTRVIPKVIYGTGLAINSRSTATAPPEFYSVPRCARLAWRGHQRSGAPVSSTFLPASPLLPGPRVPRASSTTPVRYCPLLSTLQNAPLQGKITSMMADDRCKVDAGELFALSSHRPDLLQLPPYYKSSWEIVAACGEVRGQRGC